MKFCTLLWKKTATQKIFCIAVISEMHLANCDAIPGKLFPAWHIWFKTTASMLNRLRTCRNKREALALVDKLIFKICHILGVPKME